RPSAPSSPRRATATIGLLARSRGVDCPDCHLSVVAAPLAAALAIVAARVVSGPILVPGVERLRRFGACVLALVVVVLALVVLVLALVVLGLGLIGRVVGRLGRLRGFGRLAGFGSLRGIRRLAGFGRLARLELVAWLRG